MACSEFEQVLSAYADGEATEAERWQVEVHLAVCPGCRSRLAAIRGAKKALSGLPVPETPADLKASILAAALRGANAPRHRWAWWSAARQRLTWAWAALMPRYGFAFGLAAFVLVGAWIQREQEEPVALDVMLSAHHRYSQGQTLAQDDAPAPLGPVSKTVERPELTEDDETHDL